MAKRTTDTAKSRISDSGLPTCVKRDADISLCPHQDPEGELAWLLRFIEGYAQRRNDVAHGVVRLAHIVLDPNKTLLSFEGSPQWFLVPPHFRGNKFVAPHVPAYALTSREINGFAKAFWPIIRRASSLADDVELPRHALRRNSAVPPLPYWSRRRRARLVAPRNSQERAPCRRAQSSARRK
jgi:hypothetical protein